MFVDWIKNGCFIGSPSKRTQWETSPSSDQASSLYLICPRCPSWATSRAPLLLVSLFPIHPRLRLQAHEPFIPASAPCMTTSPTSLKSSAQKSQHFGHCQVPHSVTQCPLTLPLAFHHAGRLKPKCLFICLHVYNVLPLTGRPLVQLTITSPAGRTYCLA